MKRLMAMIVMAVSCLLQQGCYMFVDREGKYYASTKELWKERPSGPGAWFPELQTAGEGMYYFGCFIPVVGWVTLCPAGLVLSVGERCAVAPVFDTICLPCDCINNVCYQVDEANYKAFESRLDTELDAVLADSIYWSERTDDKFRYLSRWLSQNIDKVDLTPKRVSAILSILRWNAKERRWLDDEMMLIYRKIVSIVYHDKSIAQESLTGLANWFVEMKNDTNIYVDVFFNAELSLWREDWVKFNDEQLRLLQDAGIQTKAIEKILKSRKDKKGK